MSDQGERKEDVNGDYGAGKYCPEDEGGTCYSLGELENVIDDPKASYEDKLEAWVGWRRSSATSSAMIWSAGTALGGRRTTGWTGGASSAPRRAAGAGGAWTLIVVAILRGANAAAPRRS